MNEKIYHLGVKALIQNASGDFLVLEVNQEKFKNPHPDGYWDIPGGRVTNDQTIEETLRREVEEETGITHIHSFEPLETLVSNIEIPLFDGQKVGLVLSIYRCELVEHPVVTLSAEHTDYAWVSPEKAGQLLLHKYPPSFTEKVKNLTPSYRKAG